MDDKLPVPIRTDLFRFVTIRTPQLVPEEKKRLGFIFHPDPSKSFFLENVHTRDIDEARRAVREKMDSFKPSTQEEIRDASPAMYAFSTWLARNRNLLTEEDVVRKADKLNGVGEGLLLGLWDNLFYQTLKRKNHILRQTCIQLIIANNFIETLKRPNIKQIAEKVIETPREPLPPAIEKRYELFLRRLANAKVVIPKAFSVPRRQIKAGKDKKVVTELTPGFSELKRQHLLSKTDHRIETYNRVKREIRVGMNTLKTPEKDLAALEAAVGETAEFLSPETRSFLKANPKSGVTQKMAEDLIDDKIREENRRTLRSLNGTHSLNGRTGEGHMAPYSFVVSINKVEDDVEVLMTFYTGWPGAFLRSSEYEILFDDDSPLKGGSPVKLDADKRNLLTLQLFPRQKPNLNGKSSFRLRGNMTFNNDARVAFDVDGAINSTATYGQATLVEGDDPDEIPELEAGRLFGVNRVGIGVFRKVEQEVCCYVPGEVSRIENIMAREYKERSTRSLISSETSEETITEVEVENQSDTVSTTRNDLATEVANELTTQTSIGTGASLGVQGKFPGGSVTADGYFDFASSTSASESDSVAQTYAQEVTESALERVLQKTTQKRTSKMITEFEENNRHGFDNRKGDQHVTGVYRWVDIVYVNRVINYGKRLMFEFVIPEPARFYKMALEKKAKQEAGSGSESNQAEEPKHPSEHGINSAADITEDNYLEMGRLYGVTLDDPITPAEESITKSFGPGDDPNGDEDPNAKERDYQYKLNFLEFGDLSKYSAVEVTANFNFDYHLKAPTETGTYFILKVYDETIQYDKENLAPSDGTSKAKSANKKGQMTRSLPEVKNSLSLSVEIKNVYNFSINLVVKLEVDEQETINWQNSVYDKIMKAYDAMLAEYEKGETKAEKAAGAKEKRQMSTDPEFNRTIEQREIQRIAIEMLAKPFGFKVGEDFYFPGPFKIPQVEQTRQWDVYAAHVKFFEQAFDWNLMAYLFYPYYWADKSDWIDLLQTKSAADPIFEAFLQSGMARAVIPVRRGFEEAVDYYMETGDIWNGGGLVLDTDDDLYLSIEEELQETEGFVGKEWQTRVPTTLTIIQGSSVYLEDEGLPCCNRLEEAGVVTLLKPSNVILGESTTITE